MNPRGEPFAHVNTAAALASRLGVSAEVYKRIVDECQESKAKYSELRFSIRGRSRVIQIPCQELKAIQKRIAYFLAPLNDSFGECCHGYIPRRSTRTNALPHCGAKWVQKFDVSDFFGSTSRNRVYESLIKAGARDDVASSLSWICTFKDKLPLGSPASPILSNLILSELDDRLISISEAQRIVYTRYADDLTFSGDYRFDVEHLVSKAVEDLGYNINQSKSALHRRGQAIRVTGLTVAEGDYPRLPKAFKRRLRSDMYYVSRYGVEDHAMRVADSLGYDGERSDLEDSVAHHILGKLLYAFSIEPKWAATLVAAYPDAAKNVGWQPSVEKRNMRRLQLLESIRNGDPEPRLKPGQIVYLDGIEPQPLVLDSMRMRKKRRFSHVGMRV